MQRILTALFVLGLISACGKLPGYKVNETTQDFTQSGVTNDKVDILFVIDNSGSMADNQANVASNFSSFISQFASRNLKFQIGVVSTDAYKVNWTSPTSYTFASGTTGHWDCSSYTPVTNCPYNGISNGGAGTLLHKTANSKILTPETTNYVTQFQQNILLGTKGSGAEQGLISTMLALSPARTQVGAWNNEFVRDGAYLAVILVSDEDEGVSATNTDYLRDSAAALDARLDQFEDYMKSLKPDDTRMVRFDAIVDTSGSSCGNTLQDGIAYEQAATRLGGRIMSICDNFGTTLADLGSEILSAVTRFKLRQPPQGDITVYVNGVLVPNDATNGWTYDSSTLEITFHGTAVPSVGQSIQLVYVPGAPA